MLFAIFPLNKLKAFNCNDVAACSNNETKFWGNEIFFAQTVKVGLIS